MIGGSVEMEIIILSLTVFLLLIYCVYIHLQLQRFKSDFQALSIEIGNLDSATTNLKTWTFEMYKWVRGRWK
jgi:hypothetical protein